MGENLDLPERHPVRTPMQWTPEGAGGFSVADPGAWVRAPVLQGPFAPAFVNAETQKVEGDSLFSTIQRLVRARRAAANRLGGSGGARSRRAVDPCPSRPLAGRRGGDAAQSRRPTGDGGPRVRDRRSALHQPAAAGCRRTRRVRWRMAARTVRLRVAAPRLRHGLSGTTHREGTARRNRDQVLPRKSVAGSNGTSYLQTIRSCISWSRPRPSEFV